MRIYLPIIARRPGTKFHPRHFLSLCETLGADTVALTDDLAEVRRGDAVMVIRGPGTNCISRRAIAAKASGEHFVFDQFSPEELATLREPRARLTIDFGWEYLRAREIVVSGLAEALEELSLDPESIFLLHSNLSVGPAFEAAWASASPAPAPRSLAFPVALALATFYQEAQQTDWRDRLAVVRRRMLSGDKSRLFCCFNGEGRLHRFYFLAALASKGLMDRGYCSMLDYRKGRPGEPHPGHDHVFRGLQKTPRFDEIKPHLDALTARLPLVLDISSIKTQEVESVAWTSQNPRFYDDSWISIVLDSAFFEDDMLFITEKAAKPIMNGSPFLYLGNAGADLALAELGFATFEPLLAQPRASESFERLWSAVDEVKRLADYDGEALQAFAVDAWPQTKHNFVHFWTAFPDLLRTRFRQSVLDGMAPSS